MGETVPEQPVKPISVYLKPSGLESRSTCKPNFCLKIQWQNDIQKDTMDVPGYGTLYIVYINDIMTSKKVQWMYQGISSCAVLRMQT